MRDEEDDIVTYQLSLENTQVQLSSVGASILQYLVRPDDDTDYEDIVLGYPTGKSLYESQNPFYFQTVVGRVANRIANGAFSLNGREYVLDRNDNNINSLHGGSMGLNRRTWKVASTGLIHHASWCDAPYIRFTYDSPDGEGGYPGHVRISATYSLRPCISGQGTTLRLQLEAQLMDRNTLGEEDIRSTLQTPINLAQHSYFNLAPTRLPSDGILKHQLLLESDTYMPVDVNSIPTKELQSTIEDPIMDLSISSPRRLEDVLRGIGMKGSLSAQAVEEDMQQRHTSSHPYGLDHNYVLRSPQSGVVLPKVATLSCGSRRLTVHASTPGVQVYTGNYLGIDDEEGITAPDRVPTKQQYRKWDGICLETQHFPDSIKDDPDSDKDYVRCKCPILTPEQPCYEHVVEYTIEHLEGATFVGSDTNGHQYVSIDDMWSGQNLKTWYSESLAYYDENCPSTVDGVLGGLGEVSDADLAGSRSFVESLGFSANSRKKMACECGAGIGRVSKGLLLDVCDRCDVVESCSRLLYAAPDYIGEESHRCRFFCTQLQDWVPQANKYDLIWVQWTVIYLTDADLVMFLQRCSKALVQGGFIVLKENVCEDETFCVDVEDASLTRSRAYWRSLIFQAGLRIARDKVQDDFPTDIYPVPMLALQPMEWSPVLL